jgi:hypothetical protein
MGVYGISYRVPRATLVLLHWHFLQIIISGFNWRFFISKETSLLGESIPRIHIAFATIGLILYVFVASVVIYWPYRYGQLMLDKHKRNRLMFGTALVYFLHTLPLWIIEFDIVWSYGWFSVIQGVSFIFTTISWVLETLGVWYAYMWHMSSFMHNNYANTWFGRGGL